MDQSKANNRRQADQTEVILDLKPTGEITPAWRRLWQILFMQGPRPASKGDIGSGQPPEGKESAE